MDRREFLKKFVALSSASLIINGCTQPQNPSTNKRFEDIVPNTTKNIPPKKVEESMPVAVYGPPSYFEGSQNE